MKKLPYICIALLILSEVYLLGMLVRQKCEISIKDNYASVIAEKLHAMETQFRMQMENVGLGLIMQHY